MSVPDAIRTKLRDHLWQIADSVDWLALGPVEKSRFYENWTKDPEVGVVLQRYMPIGRVRVYIKDSLLKDYHRARRANKDKPFRMLGLSNNMPTTRDFLKPHGRQLADGKVVCWGRAADWKLVLMAVFERSRGVERATPYAAVLTESGGKFAEASLRAVVNEAAERLGIERLIWDT